VRKSAKSKKINIFKYINKKILFIFFCLFLVLAIGYKIEFFPKTPIYATERTTLLAKVSPSLVSLDENNVPIPPLKNDQVIFNGSRNTRRIALTFDADMTPLMKNLLDSGRVKSYYNKKVIDVLNQTQTKATLFLAGMWIELYPQATKELASNPLIELGNHSYSHPSFSGTCFGLGEIPLSKDAQEIAKTKELLRTVAGVNDKFFRFPGGCYSKENLDIVKKEGLMVIHWDVAGEDGFNNYTESIERNVIDNVRNGSIIVLHMNGAPNSPKTAEALPKIISTLKEKGFVFVKVSELLNMDSLQPLSIRDFIKSDFGL